LPGALTGKLSDVAGLFYLPVLLTATVNSARWLWRGRPSPSPGLRPWQLWLSLAATGLAFALLQVWGPAAAAAAGLGRWLGGTPRAPIYDPADLWALGVLPLSYLHARRFYGAGAAGGGGAAETRGSPSASSGGANRPMP